MAFFVSTWPGRVILVIGSIIILAVAFGVVVGGLAITGGPEDGEPGGDLWDKLPPDGAIAFGDFLSLLRQFGHSCA